MVSKVKVVMIDDEESFCLMVRKKLNETERFEVVTSTDPEEAAGLVQKENPDLILLDIVMPSRRGDEIVKALKKDPETEKIPIIIISGKGEMVYNAKKDDYTWKPHTDLVKSRGEIPDVKRAEAFAEAYGVQDYVSKPFAIDLLINVIDDVMVKYKKPDEQDEDEQLI